MTRIRRILITGAGGSAAYNVIMSLRNNPAGEKFYIVGADVSRYHIELAPVDKRYLIPKVTEKNYIQVLNQIIRKEKIEFLHAQPDVEVNFLAKNQDKINTKTFLPNYETIELCQDKMAFNTLLQKNNIAVPETYHITSEGQLKKALQKLFKRHEKVWLRAIRGAGSRAALPVKEFSHAKAWIDYWQTMKGVGYGDFMASEFLPGKEYAFQSLWHNGKLLMSQARERIEYIFGNLTPSGQSSSPSVAKTVHSKEVNELATKAILSIDPQATGIFCADIKTDSSGQVKLTEINIGRFFTTSYFFSSAGLNMPYYYLKLALDGEITPRIKPYNSIPKDWYWVRMIDMGYALIKPNKWTSKKI